MFLFFGFLAITFCLLNISPTVAYAGCDHSADIIPGLYEDHTDGPYVDNKNGTISDRGTGLMWQKTSDETARNYSDACDHCDNLEFGGHSDWELPDIYQLQTIVDTNFSPTINPAFGCSKEKTYISGTTWKYAGGTTCYVVQFADGNTSAVSLAHERSTRCVRIENPTPDGPLALQISANKLEGEAPLEVSFSAVGSGGAYPYYPQPYAFSWDFGYYHMEAQNQNYNQTFWHPGKYTVNCTVTDNSAKTLKKTINVISVKSGTTPSTQLPEQESMLVDNFHGDDGIDGPYRSIDDSVIFDENTGLVWEKYPSGSTFTWNQAVTHCQDLILNSYDDWDLPNIFQLQTIVKEPGTPTINTEYFKNTKAKQYWSGTTNLGGWYNYAVNFSDGRTEYNADFFNPKSYYVRCVRLGSFPPPFSDDEEGSLKVTITPQASIDDGAQWRVDGGVWRDSGGTQSGLSVGSHIVDFKEINGWTKPGDTTVNIQSGQTTTLTKSYSAQGLSNLTPYKPSDWSDKIVVSKSENTNSDSSPLYTTDKLWIDWAVINNGSVGISTRFYIKIYVDGTLKHTWYVDTLDVNYYSYVEDYSIGSLEAGTHTLKIASDETNVIDEENETDNEYVKTIEVKIDPTVSYVSSDGNCGTKEPCYSKIQDAIDTAATGSTIFVKKGTYAEILSLGSNKNLLIKGGYNEAYDEQTANTTFINAPGPTNIKASSGSLKISNDKCKISNSFDGVTQKRKRHIKGEFSQLKSSLLTCKVAFFQL